MEVILRLRFLFAFALLNAVLVPHVRSAPVNGDFIEHLPHFQSHNGSIMLGKDEWREEPSGRGSWGILVSCLSTFFFCIWTAVHPDIIATDPHGNYRWGYKVSLLLMAMFVPEALVMFALGQLVQAVELRRKVSSLPNRKDNEGKELPAVYISMEEAHFVIMGGFVIDGPQEPATPQESVVHCNKKEDTTSVVTVCTLRKTSKPTSTTSTLTPDGFIDLLEQDRIDIDPEPKRKPRPFWMTILMLGHEQPKVFRLHYTRKIKDKSVIAKLLASIQVLWLLVQSIERINQHLSLTLLEVHILIQVIFTVIMYGLWWFKPMDDGNICPIKVEGPKSENKEHYYEQCAGHTIAIFAKACYDVLSALRSEKGLTYTLLLTESFLVAASGALHAAVWKSHFPTAIEGLLWKLSSIGMIVIPLIVVIIAGAASYETTLLNTLYEQQYNNISGPREAMRSITRAIRKRSKNGTSTGRMKPWAHICAMWACLFLIGVYTVCALYLLIEGIVSMRSPPLDAFKTASWGTHWPHLTG